MGPNCRNGATEHLERARWFLELAEARGGVERFRLQMAAVYSARAIVELLLEAGSKGDTPLSRPEVEVLLEPLLPRYFLIERLRIHDFHRFGLRPPSGNSMLMQGPMKLVARHGSAAAWLDPNDGLKTTVSGNLSVRLARPLQIRGSEFLDDETGEWVTLARILEEFLREVPSALDAFDHGSAGQ